MPFRLLLLLVLFGCAHPSKTAIVGRVPAGSIRYLICTDIDGPYWGINELVKFDLAAALSTRGFEQEDEGAIGVAGLQWLKQSPAQLMNKKMTNYSDLPPSNGATARVVALVEGSTKKTFVPWTRSLLNFVMFVGLLALDWHFNHTNKSYPALSGGAEVVPWSIIHWAVIGNDGTIVGAGYTANGDMVSFGPGSAKARERIFEQVTADISRNIGMGPAGN